MEKKLIDVTDKEIEEFYKKIGMNVKKFREKKKMSQLDLSQAIGHKSVSLVSAGEICFDKRHFNIEHLYKIAKVLDVDVCEFFR